MLLARLPTLEYYRLGGHTGGNLLLSMMQQYSGDFLAAVDGLRGLIGCAAASGRFRSSRRACARITATAAGRRGMSRWTLPTTPVTACPACGWSGGPHFAGARPRHIARFDAAVIGPGSFYTSLMPIFSGEGGAEALARVTGRCPGHELLTEGRGMTDFNRGDRRPSAGGDARAPIDVAIVNTRAPPGATLARYADEHKAPLDSATSPPGVTWCPGVLVREIGAPRSPRLAQAVWAVLARRLL